MTGRSRRPRTDLPEYVDALEDDQGICRGRAAEFVDYPDSETPDREAAEELCIECPMMLICRQNARHRKPKRGVWGGIAWVDGKQLHLLSPERRAELLEE